MQKQKIASGILIPGYAEEPDILFGLKVSEARLWEKVKGPGPMLEKREVSPVMQGADSIFYPKYRFCPR